VTRRFYIEPPALDVDEVPLPAALAHRLSRVLRLTPGDTIVLFDGSGFDATARIDALNERAGTATILDRRAGMPEPRTRVHLYQAISKGERFEWLVEKATEIGVARIVPLITARSVVRTRGDAGRIERWRRIAVEAAEQCGRTAVPAVDVPQSFAAAVAEAPGVLLVPYETAGEGALEIPTALDRHVDALFATAEVSILIGPEGGFAPEEIAAAQERNASIVTLGRRTLRAETAGLVALTLVLHVTGELN